jgi:hypothetical protein
MLLQAKLVDYPQEGTMEVLAMLAMLAMLAVVLVLMLLAAILAAMETTLAAKVVVLSWCVM